MNRRRCGLAGPDRTGAASGGVAAMSETAAGGAAAGPAAILGAAMLLAWLAAGCAGPGPAGPAVQSELAGQWRGRLASRSTRDAEGRFEDFALTLLPDGRFPSLGVVDASGAGRAGQVLRQGGKPVARVVQADYGPTQSRLCLEFLGLTDPAGQAVRSGGTASARLRADGQLEYQLFGYAMSAGQPARCEAIYQAGLLRREPPSDRPHTQPDR